MSRRPRPPVFATLDTLMSAQASENALQCLLVVGTPVQEVPVRPPVFVHYAFITDTLHTFWTRILIVDFDSWQEFVFEHEGVRWLADANLWLPDDGRGWRCAGYPVKTAPGNPQYRTTDTEAWAEIPVREVALGSPETLKMPIGDCIPRMVPPWRTP